MTLRYSTGLRDFLNSGGSLKQALNNGRIEVYTGSQPASGDSAASGTLLCTFTSSGGSWTAETPATATITLTGGGSGSITAVTIDGVGLLDATVPFNTSLNQTAADLAAALNRSAWNNDWYASVSGAVVTLTANPNLGARYNGKTLAVTATTITTSLVNPASGAYAVNGLQLEDSSLGTIVKRISQTWQGTAVASGTAGWFRHYGPGTDAGGADSTGRMLRMDGAIAASGQQMNMSPTTMTSGAVQTISAYAPTLPANGT